MHNITKVPYNYFVNILLKLLPFISLNFDTKECENVKKKRITTKHRMFGAKNLGQPRKFDTTAGCDC